MDEYYILESDCDPHQRGTLFKRDEFGHYHVYGSTEAENQLLPKLGCLTPILPEEFDLLIAVLEVNNRIVIWNDKQWLKEGMEITEGSHVKIINYPDSPDAWGTVRYIGPLVDRLGTNFGVELAHEFEGLGATDGTFRKKRYFTCPDDCGMFVSLYKLRMFGYGGLGYQASYNSNFNALQYSDFPFKLEERVVWFTDNGPEKGTIKWIGVLPDSATEDIVVGVWFDNQVGTGTGRYKGHQLFQTPRGYASLMPPIGLIKESDFDCGYNDSEVTTYDDDTNAGFPNTNGQRIVLTSVNTPYHIQVGSSVYIKKGEKRYGVVRYIGNHPKNPDKLMAGLEMDVSDETLYSDGSFIGTKYFTCLPQRAFFVYLEHCFPDDRLVF